MLDTDVIVYFEPNVLSILSIDRFLDNYTALALLINEISRHKLWASGGYLNVQDIFFVHYISTCTYIYLQDVLIQGYNKQVLIKLLRMNSKQNLLP